MTTESHEGVDYVSGVTVSSTVAFSAAIEACKQYENDKQIALFGVTASYEEATLASLPAETNILKVYVGKVDDVAKVIGYEVKLQFSFSTGHGKANIDGMYYISFNLEDDTIVSSIALDGGSTKEFSASATTFGASLSGLEASAVAAMTKDSHEGVDYISGATKSSEKILTLAIEACAQYALDKVNLSGGAA